MNGVWNLNPLYHGFEDPAFEADLTELKKKVVRFEEFAGNLEGLDPARGLKEGITLQEDIQFLAAKLVEVNEAKNLCNRVPSVKEVEKMIEQAKELEPLMEY